MKKRRPTAYDRGQHELICGAINISPDPKAPDLTAYEGVCVLLEKLDIAEQALTEHAKSAGWARKALEDMRQMDHPLVLRCR